MGLFDRWKSGNGTGDTQAIQPGKTAEELLAEGMSLEEGGRLEEALACYDAALGLDPRLGRAHFNRGNILLEQGMPEVALVSYEAALRIKPDSAAAHYNRGNACACLGRMEDGKAAYQQALRLKPDFADAEVALGGVLEHQGQFDAASASYRRALAIRPDDAETHYKLGNALVGLGQQEGAVASFRRALEIDSGHVDAHNNLGVVLHRLGQFSGAAASYRRVLEIHPDSVETLSNLGSALADLGFMEEAAGYYRQALAIQDDCVPARDNLLFIHNYLADRSPAELLAEARAFGDIVARQAHPATAWSNIPEPERCLRVGLVSGDLGDHPVGYFVEGILAALAARASGRLEIFAYPSRVRDDTTSQRIRSCCRGWHAAAGLSDRQLAQRIREDGIDILIDLAGHTEHNRLPMFAWKPAPVQVSWLGYFATTGVGAIDYLLADPWTLPASQEASFTERIWRLPETRLCFTPPAAPVEVGPLPALGEGGITFGCFNNLSKINDAVVALWARVLAAVPDSRLFLKTKQLKETSVRQHILDRFAACGIDRERLILEGPVSRAEYFAAYRRVDIALDPFPYPGGTTSVEALWMGVPVLTLGGDSFLSRQGVGLLTNAGLPEWVATDADDYVARAVSHVGDLTRLAALRAELRGRVLASPIFDAERFAGHFETALRGMWKEWCRNQINSEETGMGNISSARTEFMKLHIGGKQPKAGWKILNALNFDGVDFVGDIRDLRAFPDACCEKVYASHVMEHVGQRDFLATLKGIHRILCEGGEFYFSVPDLEVLCRLFLSPELDVAARFHVMRMMFGGQVDDYDFHYIGLTYEFMVDFFRAAGFSSVRRVASFGVFDDTSNGIAYGTPISLNLIATK